MVSRVSGTMTAALFLGVGIGSNLPGFLRGAVDLGHIITASAGYALATGALAIFITLTRGGRRERQLKEPCEQRQGIQEPNHPRKGSSAMSQKVFRITKDSTWIVDPHRHEQTHAYPLINPKTCPGAQLEFHITEIRAGGGRALDDVHPNEDHVFYVLSGRATARVGDEMYSWSRETRSGSPRTRHTTSTLSGVRRFESLSSSRRLARFGAERAGSEARNLASKEEERATPFLPLERVVLIATAVRRSRRSLEPATRGLTLLSPRSISIPM